MVAANGPDLRLPHHHAAAAYEKSCVRLVIIGLICLLITKMKGPRFMRAFHLGSAEISEGKVGYGNRIANLQQEAVGASERVQGFFLLGGDSLLLGYPAVLEVGDRAG